MNLKDRYYAYTMVALSDLLYLLVSQKKTT